MKIITLVYNKATKQYILEPYRKKERNEFGDFCSLKNKLHELYEKRKIGLRTNLLEEEIIKLTSNELKIVKIIEMKEE